MNLKNKFRKYLRPKYALKLVNVLLIMAMLLTSLPMATQAATPQRQGQVDPCIASTVIDDEEGTGGTGDTDDDDISVYLPIIVQTTNLFRSAANLLGLPQAPTQVARELSYEVGKMYTYNYVVEVASTSHQRTVEGESQTGNNTTIVKMDADIAIESQNDDGSFNGTIVLNNPSICSSDGENQEIADTESFSAELQKPLRFTQAANGVITNVQIPEGSNATATNMQKGVINALQMTLKDEDSYVELEAGGQGKYNVAYTLAEADGNLSIKKAYDQDSFTEQTREGDETSAFSLDTSLDATLDGTQGILTSVMGDETIETGDGVEDPDGSNEGFTGATAWTTIKTKTSLTFDSMSDAPAIRAAALNLVYQEDDLSANFDEDQGSPTLTDIDAESLDLNAEVQALVDDPENMELFLRVLNIIALDDSNEVLDLVAAQLTANADNEAVTTLLIDLLIETGTPYAQDILSGILGNDTVQAASLSATLSITTEEHALIGLVLIDSPTMTTVNTVKALSSEEDGALQDTAVSVLGAAIDKLADNGDEDMSSELANDLVASLGAAESEEDLELYLGALGNASHPDTLDTVSEYLTGTLTLANGTEITETTGIRFAALSAAGNFEGQEAEDILVEALSNQDELLGFRLTAFDALSGRSDLSSAGLAALNDNSALGSIGTEGEGTPPEELDDELFDEGVWAANSSAINGVYSRNWNRRYGNSKLGVELPGTFTAKSPPHYNGLYLYAQQRANGLVWNRTINLVDGRTQFWRNSSTTYKFGAYLYLLDYRIRKQYEQQFNCAWSRSANLWQGSQSVRFNYRIPILAIISVGVEINLGVSARLDYRLNANVCNPANMTGSAAIIPSGYATANASAYLSLWLVRGGVGVSAKILHTAFTLQLSARVNAINRTARLCATITVSMQAIDGRVFAYADRKSISWRGFKWKRIWTGNLANFSSPRQNFTLWNACWP